MFLARKDVDYTRVFKIHKDKAPWKSLDELNNKFISVSGSSVNWYDNPASSGNTNLNGMYTALLIKLTVRTPAGKEVILWTGGLDTELVGDHYEIKHVTQRGYDSGSEECELFYLRRVSINSAYLNFPGNESCRWPQNSAGYTYSGEYTDILSGRFASVTRGYNFLSSGQFYRSDGTLVATVNDSYVENSMGGPLVKSLITMMTTSLAYNIYSPSENLTRDSSHPASKLIRGVLTNIGTKGHMDLEGQPNLGMAILQRSYNNSSMSSLDGYSFISSEDVTINKLKFVKSMPHMYIGLTTCYPSGYTSGITVPYWDIYNHPSVNGADAYINVGLKKYKNENWSINYKGITSNSDILILPFSGADGTPSNRLFVKSAFNTQGMSFLFKKLAKTTVIYTS